MYLKLKFARPICITLKFIIPRLAVLLRGTGILPGFSTTCNADRFGDVHVSACTFVRRTCWSAYVWGVVRIARHIEIFAYICWWCCTYCNVIWESHRWIAITKYSCCSCTFCELHMVSVLQTCISYFRRYFGKLAQILRYHNRVCFHTFYFVSFSKK